MKVLFVSSGKKNGQPGSLICSQGDSLNKRGLDVNYFTIKHKGVIGYLKESVNLRRILKEGNYDIIHAHYGLTAIISLVARRKEKLIVSFMGDDLVGSNKQDGRITKISLILAKVNSLFAKWFYNFSIVKSEEMSRCLKTYKTSLIPNGVDINIFKPIDKSTARKKLGITSPDKILLFVSNISRKEKNYKLAQEAVGLLGNAEIKIISVSGVDQDNLTYYYNSADALLLTSYHEGSPNVIKEAMACNCPIVSTDVGDVKWIFGNTEGCYIASFDPRDFAKKIILVLEFSKKKGRTNGRERIIKLGLDSNTVANRIIEMYRKVLI